MSFCLAPERAAQPRAATATAVAAPPRCTAFAYRADIDGLRAVAITMVIAYHAAPRLVPGGFSGVDLFFVISGYLITGLIVAGVQAQSFSVLAFYQRRVRRIVPALLVVLTACLAVGWFTLLPGEFRWLGRSILWCAPFLANVFFAHVTGYFDPGADYNLLLHLWSLGVEEQFYLLWPILLLLAMRYGVTMRVLGAVIISSLAISLWGARHAPATHFFLPGPRAWELALGGVLAARQLLAPRPPPGNSAADTQRGRAWTAAASVAGAVLIGASALLLDAQDIFPGAWAALPAGGAVLLIAGGPGALLNRRVLGSRPLVLVGKISYSLYLWHWPAFTFTRAILGPALSPTAVALVIAGSVAAAVASYRLIEMPVRRAAGTGPVVALLAGLAGFTVLGATIANGALPGRLSGPQFAGWDAAVTDWKIPAEVNADERTEFTTAALRSERSATTLFIGDSHMQQYWPRIAHLVASRPQSARSVLFTAYAGCPILPGLNSLRQPRNCDGFFSYASAQALRPEVDTVVFGAFWELYLLAEYQLGSQHGVYSSADPLHRRLRLGSPATAVALQRFGQLLTTLVASGRRVFVVLSNPTSPQFDPRWLLPRQVRLSRYVPPLVVADRPRSVDVRPFEEFVAPLMSELRAIAARSGAQVLDPRTSLCDGSICPAVGADGLPLYIDPNHIRAGYARTRASFLDETLLGP